MTRLILCIVVLSITYPFPVGAQDARSDAIVVRAIERMQGYDYNSNPKAKAAIMRHIDRSAGSAEYLELLKRFQPDGDGNQRVCCDSGSRLGGRFHDLCRGE